MKRFSLCLAGLAVLAVPSIAEELVVQVSDRDGLPVPYAVVELVGAAPLSADSAPETLVDQRERKFVPHVSIVRPGGSVRFPNSDDTRHSVYSFSDGNQFELQLYRENDAPPVKMAGSGLVKLGCNIHDNMKAYLYLTDNSSAVVTDVDGVARLSNPALQEGASLRLWHSQLPEALIVAVSVNPAAPKAAQEVSLPISWVDPQAAKSTADLEQLLKRYARDSN